MWLRRLLWWINGRVNAIAVNAIAVNAIEEAAERQIETEEMKRMTAELRQRQQLWEGERLRNVWLKRSDVASPPDVSLNDDLTNWLWHAAFDTCRQTEDWDLLNACAGIAHAIRTEGIPLSSGLRASAAPARSGGPALGSE